MANPEHLEILKQGVEQWNRWREERPEVVPDLNEVDLFGLDLRGANLESTNLIGSDCGTTDFSGAVLDWANLTAANLIEATFADASMFNTNLGGAVLDETNFDNAVFGQTELGGLDLRGSERLDTVKHRAPSTIGIDTIYRSNGKIPEVFLRGCGVPDDFIKYIGSMMGRPIEYYSCFISYSSRDQEFAERLYADLQSTGVRCWFAPEDLKIGDRFQERIEESIRVHDKLLLVLSENSVVSPWVEREVQAAFEREHRSKKLVLFPIRVDETVMEASQAWAADIRRTRHIGEFGNWRDHDSYKKALERLLRDLRAGAGAPVDPSDCRP